MRFVFGFLKREPHIWAFFARLFSGLLFQSCVYSVHNFIFTRIRSVTSTILRRIFPIMLTWISWTCTRAMQMQHKWDVRNERCPLRMRIYWKCAREMIISFSTTISTRSIVTCRKICNLRTNERVNNICAWMTEIWATEGTELVQSHYRLFSQLIDNTEYCVVVKLRASINFWKTPIIAILTILTYLFYFSIERSWIESLLRWRLLQFIQSSISERVWYDFTT